VILTRKSVIYKRIVLFLHEICNFHTQCEFDRHECEFNTLKSDFYTKSAFSTRRVDTYLCEYDTHECDYDTLECDLYT
jgi:hypothetical protein